MPKSTHVQGGYAIYGTEEDEKQRKLNPNRSDFKVYSGDDNGNLHLGWRRQAAAHKRILKKQKWKPKGDP